MECNSCAKCCIEKTVALSTEDVERIQRIRSSPFFRTRITGSKVMYWKEHQGKSLCVFLNPNTYKCEIYEHRPQVCREYYCETIGGGY